MYVYRSRIRMTGYVYIRLYKIMLSWSCTIIYWSHQQSAVILFAIYAYQYWCFAVFFFFFLVFCFLFVSFNPLYPLDKWLVGSWFPHQILNPRPQQWKCGPPNHWTKRDVPCNLIVRACSRGPARDKERVKRRCKDEGLRPLGAPSSPYVPSAR